MSSPKGGGGGLECHFEVKNFALHQQGTGQKSENFFEKFQCGWKIIPIFANPTNINNLFKLNI